MAWYNVFARAVLRSPIHGLFSGSTLLVNYVGCKSKKKYSVPVNYLKIDDCYYILSSRQRVWWRNLRDGVQITFDVQGEEIEVFAKVIEDCPSIIQHLHRYFDHSPKHVRYFKLELDKDGKPTEAALPRMADEWVVVVGNVRG